jgi:surface antigen
VLGLVAFAALVAGAVLAELSSSGAPTSTQTAVVRWIILAALAGAVVAYVIGGRLQPPDA